MKIILASFLTSSTYGFIMPKLCRCRFSLHVSVGSERNDSQEPCFTTTSKLFNESKLFLDSQEEDKIHEENIDLTQSVSGDHSFVSVFPDITDTIGEEAKLPQSSATERTMNRVDKETEMKASIAMLSFVANTADENVNAILDLEEDINEATRKINEVNFQLDEIAKDASTIQVFDSNRNIVDDQKIYIQIQKVVIEALNGYENSDRLTSFCERLFECRMSIMKLTEIEISADQTMTGTSLTSVSDSKAAVGESKEKVDDIVSSISDELKMQIHIELFREKKITDLLIAVERSIQIKTFDIADQEEYIGKDDIASEKTVSLLKATTTCDHELLIALTDFNLYMKNIYEKTCRRRRKMENALQTIQSVEWTDSVGIELVLSEINSLEDVLKKATKEIESESRAIYALKDRFEDDLMGKISVLNTYGIRVNDESML